MDGADHRLIRQVVVAQGMATPEQADEALGLIDQGLSDKSLPDLLLERGAVTAEDHAILLRIFQPKPPSAPPAARPVEDMDTTLEKIVTATGMLTSEFIQAAKEARDRRPEPHRAPLHQVLHEEGYITRMQVTDLVKTLNNPEYRCEGCGKAYDRGRGAPARCPKCGLSLPGLGVPISLEATFDQELMRPVGTLSVLLGVNRGFVYELAEGARVPMGRRASNKIRLFGKQVSRAHAEIVSEGSKLELRDKGSSFGTLVNGRAVANHTLHDGDLIKIGGTVLEFRAAPRTDAGLSSGEDVTDVLFGKIAVRMGLSTQRDVDEAVALQETTHSDRKIGQILVERNSLTQSGMLRVLQVQRRNLRSAGSFSDETTEKALFGRLAVREGLISEGQLNEALRTQAKTEAFSGLHMKIGEILVRKGHLSADGVQRVLALQGRGELALPVPGFELRAKLGEGGMGAVFLARQVSLDREVAIKVLAPRLAKDEFFIDRFLREARAAAALSHENIIRAIDVGEASGHYYFVMEYVEGETVLDVVRRRGPLPENEVIDIAVQVSRALDHAFQHQIIHRDVKPENIMMTHDGTAKLCDLGLARTVAPEGGRDTEEAVGTPNYVSPEQARGDRNVDIRTDIYSLGATLYHLATGQMPFKKPGSPLVVMARHITEEIPHPKRVAPNLSDDLCLVLRKTMAKDPKRRYETPRHLLDDLMMIKAGRSPKFAKIGSSPSTIARS